MRDGKQRRSGKPEQIGDDADLLAELLDRAQARPELLSDRTISFVDRLAADFARFGRHTSTTQKQRDWLRDVRRTLDAAAEREGEIG